jgi:lipopolysaccharide export system permease protein
MPGMKLLDRYLAREMVVPFLIGQAAVVLMLTGTVLYNNADTFLSYNIPAIGVAKIALYFMPYLVGLTMPVATAIAISLTVSRLCRDSEITVFRAAGVSLKRSFAAAYAVGLALSLVAFVFGERVVPWANAQYERTMAELSRQVRFLAPKEGQVVQSADRRYTVYVGRMQVSHGRTTFHDVTFLVRMPNNPIPNVIHAGAADYRDGRWTLRNARLHAYEDQGDRELFSRARTIELDFRLPEQMFNMIYLQLPLYSASATVSFRELAARIATQRRSGYVSPQDLLDLHFKLSVPLSCMVFAIACPPLAMRFARAGGFMGVLLSIILVFVYWNTLLAAKIIGSRYPGVLPPAVAGWGQNVAFAAVGLWFLWRSE